MDIQTTHTCVKDERGFIVGWLGKLAIGFILVAIVIFDGGSILVNFFTLDSTADEIAVRLTTNPSTQPRTFPELEQQARDLAKESGARLVSLTVEDDVVRITLRRTADTLVVGRIGFIEDWAKATVEGQAGSG